MSNRALKSEIIFQDGATANGNGNTWIVRADAQSMALDIESTSTTANINFEFRANTDTWHSFNAVDYETLNLFTSVSATDSAYLIDLTAIKEMRCRISDMTNGAVTVTGRVVT